MYIYIYIYIKHTIKKLLKHYSNTIQNIIKTLYKMNPKNKYELYWKTNIKYVCILLLRM